MNKANLEALSAMSKPKYRSVMEWWGDFSSEEKALLAQVILNNPAPKVLEALEKNADFKFKITALKSLRATLRKDLND